MLRISPKLGWFLAFTAVFAALAGFVFWGCWSPDVAFIAPDDGMFFPLSYGDVLQRWWNGVISKGRILPTDILWSGLLFSPHFCRELKYVSAVYLAALGLVYFLRGRGLSRIASYGSGLLLAFCGYWLTLFSAGHAGWFVWMSYGVFAFGLADRAICRNSFRHWMLLGLDVAWAGFEQQDLWLLFTLFTAAYIVFRCVSERVFPWKGGLVAAAVFIAVGLPNFVAITDVVKGREDQIAAGADEKGVKDDKESRWEFVTNWSMPANEVAEFVNSRVNGDTSCPFVLSINASRGARPYVGALGRLMTAPTGNYRQHSLHVGAITCLFALLGVLSAFRRSASHGTVAFFAVSAAVFFMLSLGRYFEPAYRCVFALPAGNLIRCPVKWHHLTELSLCILAAYGIEAVLLQARHMSGSIFAAVRIAIVSLVVAGAFMLASNARIYCAPVDYGRAIRSGSKASLAVLSREQFNNPQVAEMVRMGLVVSVANWLGDPNAYLVQVLKRAEPVKPKEASPLMISLGVLSLLTALTTIVLALRRLV